MLLKQFNLICHRQIMKQKHFLSSLKMNNIRSCSSVKKKIDHKSDGLSLKDFIAKDISAELSEIVSNEDTIPYVDVVDLGRNRKGK